jgi:hypothetical protein
VPLRRPELTVNYACESRENNITSRFSQMPYGSCHGK